MAEYRYAAVHRCDDNTHRGVHGQMVTHTKVKYTLAALLEGSLATPQGWRYAIIDVSPGGWYPNRDGGQARADQSAAVLYEWSPSGQVEVACRTVQSADGGVSAVPAPSTLRHLRSVPGRNGSGAVRRRRR